MNQKQVVVSKILGMPVEAGLSVFSGQAVGHSPL